MTPGWGSAGLARVAAGAVLAVLLAAAAMPGGPAVAQSAAGSGGGSADPAERLRAVEASLAAERARAAAAADRAAALAEELAVLQREAVGAARRVQDTETGIAELTETVRALDERTEARAAALLAQRERLAGLTAALLRLARTPPEAAVALPQPPLDALRGARLLGVAVPVLEAEARAVGEELQVLVALRSETEGRRAALAAARAALQGQRQALETLVARRTAAGAEAETERVERARRAGALAEEAADLRELVERLEAERQRREAAAAQARLAGLAARIRTASPLPYRHPAPGAAAIPPPPEPRGGNSEAAPRAGGSGSGLIPSDMVARPPDEARSGGGGAAGSALAALPTIPRAGPSQPMGEARGTLTPPVRGDVRGLFGERDSLGTARRGIVIATLEQAQVVAPYDGIVVFAGPFPGYGQLLILEHGDGYHSLLAGMDRIDGAVGQRLLAGEPVGVMGRATEGASELYLELRRNSEPINPLPWLAGMDSSKVRG